MTDKEQAKKPHARETGAVEGQDKRAQPAALWLGDDQNKLEMGWGRGPSKLEGHELVSWFFSRDGI